MSIFGQLYVAPAVPHAYDDEFIGTSLDAKWQLGGVTVLEGGDTLMENTLTGDNMRISVGQRESWLRLQAGSGGSLLGIYFYPLGAGIEVPDGTYWCRYAPRWRAPINNDYTAMFGLARGATFATDHVALGIETDAAQVERSLLIRENGVLEVNNESNDIETRGEPHDYLAIRKTGPLTECWSGNASGQWMRFGSSRNWVETNGPLDAVAFFVQNVTNTFPGSFIQSFDFFRYRADGELP